MKHGRGRRAWLSEVAIIAALMLLPLLFWWRLWTPDPANHAVIQEGDFTDQYYPLQLFSARELAAGRLPAWDPYLNAGQPGLADIQTATFYPLNLIPNLVLALLGVPYSLLWLTGQVCVHFSLASLFTYLFVRHLARRAGARLPAARFAGAIGALSFTYAGYLTSFPVQQLTILETAMWLPLVLLFLDRAFHHSHPERQIVLGGMALGCALLAGHPQTAMYLVYATLAYGLFLAYDSRLKSYVSRLLPIVSVLAIGLGLATVQLVPSATFIAHSTRAGLSYEEVSWGFPIAELTHLLYPGYFGGSPQYVGVLSMILAIAALFIKWARREVVFWMVMGLVALLLAFGGNTFLYDLFYLLVPGFSAVRNQERVIYLFSFAVGVLAGYGALTLVQPLPRAEREGFKRFTGGLWWVFAGFSGLTALWYLGSLYGAEQGVEINLFDGLLRHHSFALLILGGSVLLFTLRFTGKVKRPWLMALALFLISLNLFTINWRFNLGEGEGQGPFPETGLVRFLQEQPGIFRISSAGLLPGGASAGIVYELEDITGNTPLRLSSFGEFEDRAGSWRRWQLLNVQYVLDERELDGPGLERVYEEGEVKAYQVSDPLPRAWVVHDTRVVAPDSVFEIVNAEDFDPRTTAVQVLEDAGASLSGQVGPWSAAHVIEAAPGRLVLEVSPDDEGLLVVSEPFYPGWRAVVDGEGAPIYRVNHLLQGVPIQSGAHRVELSYHQSLLPMLFSLVVLAGCIAGLFLKKSSA
ncbi:YfhO family protein [Chloroflexota bacterium]